MKDALEQLIDEACQARQAAVAAAKRSHKEQAFEALWNEDKEFAPALAAAVAAATPSENTREAYRKLFGEFIGWTRIDNLPALPSTGPIVGSYLVGIAASGVPLPQVKEVASAIAWYHIAGQFYLDITYIEGAFNIIEGKHGDSGGGQSISLVPITNTIAADNVPLVTSN
jgi:hypothetical protein